MRPNRSFDAKAVQPSDQPGVLIKDAAESLCFGFIEANRQAFPVQVMCDLHGVTRSGFYARRKRQPCQRLQDEQALVARVRQIHADSREFYGSPPPGTWIRTDFNGFLDPDWLCLSHAELADDVAGPTVTLAEGMVVTAFDHDANDEGNLNMILATGTVVVALSWFRSTATEHIAKVRVLAQILDAHGIAVEVMQTARPGYPV